MSEKAAQTSKRTQKTTMPVVQMFTLSPEHFITETRNGKTVLALDPSVTIPASRVSAVLFYRTRKCEHSPGMVEVFKNAARLLTQASVKSSPPLQLPQFLLCTLNGPNRRIVRQSRETDTPLEYTPQLVLFVNNLPFKSFDWPQESATPPDVDALYNFIARGLNEVQESAVASAPVQPTSPTSNPSPADPVNTPAGPKPIVGRDMRIYSKLGLGSSESVKA